MTEIEFHCPKCEAHLIVEQQFFGKNINCPHCQADLKVPSVRHPGGESAAAAAHAQEVQDKRIQKEMARFYEHRRKRRQNQRRRIKTMLADAVLIQSQDARYILFPCLHCDQELLAPVEYHGYDVYCAGCGELIEVPDDEDAEFGANRLGKAPQDESFLAERRLKKITEDHVAYPGDLEWQRKNRGSDAVHTPALMASPATGEGELAPAGSSANGNPGYSSAVGPDGSMLINITLNPDDVYKGRPTRSGSNSSRKTSTRPGGGALKTPVKDVKELQVTGEGGKIPENDLEGLWSGELSARRWEKIIGLSVVAAFLVTMTVLGVVFLNRAEGDAEDGTSDLANAHMRGSVGDGSMTSHQRVELRPEELEEAKYVIRNYLGSESWRERLGYVRMPEVIEPLMEEYYRTHADGPIRYNSMELTWSGEVRDTFLLLISVIDANYRELFFTLERADGTYKIDWEVLVQYNPLSWKELKQRQPTDPMAFRVNLKVDNYYNFEFSDRSVYQCFRISNRQEFTGLYAYVRKDAPFYEKINLDPNFEKLAIVELAYPENPQSRNMVEIVGYVQDGWLKLKDSPVEEEQDQEQEQAQAQAQAEDLSPAEEDEPATDAEPAMPVPPANQSSSSRATSSPHSQRETADTAMQ